VTEDGCYQPSDRTHMHLGEIEAELLADRQGFSPGSS